MRCQEGGEGARVKAIDHLEQFAQEAPETKTKEYALQIAAALGERKAHNTGFIAFAITRSVSTGRERHRLMSEDSLL